MGRRKPLRVGTDCSGIEAPIEALLQMKIPFEHVFSSEINNYCIESIKANYDPEILFGDPEGPYPNGDITKRDASILPDIDLYVCGFPCQPFSTLSKQLGSRHKSGNVFQSCIKVILSKRPTYFILENVPGILTTQNGKIWAQINKQLDMLEDIGYNIQVEIMNTKDFGIPQNRKRIFIIGSTKDIDFNPQPKPMKSIRSYVDQSDKTYQSTTSKQEQYLKKHCDNVFIEMTHLSFGNNQNKSYAPCIPAQTHMWNVIYHRQMNIKEGLMLQGFSPKFVVAVSTSQMKKQIGNSMSVNVLKEIFKQLLDQSV